jgi:hypothetical protein
MALACPFADFPRVNVSSPRDAEYIRAGGSGGATSQVSSNSRPALFRVRRHRAQGVFTPLLKNQSNRLPQIR